MARNETQQHTNLAISISVSSFPFHSIPAFPYAYSDKHTCINFFLTDMVKAGVQFTWTMCAAMTQTIFTSSPVSTAQPSADSVTILVMWQSPVVSSVLTFSKQ